MTFEELQNWILSAEGMGHDLLTLRRKVCGTSTLNLSVLSLDILAFEPDWQRLLFAGSILAHSEEENHLEVALLIAHAALLNGGEQKVADAAAGILARLANSRAIDLALRRGLIKEGINQRFGIYERIAMTRRELDQSILSVLGEEISANRFQKQLWNKLNSAEWIAATAPTASGKTYLVLRWLVNELLSGDAKLAVFLAPTRALVGEVERSLTNILMELPPSRLRIASLPLVELVDGSQPTILVLTQERLQVLSNALSGNIHVDIAVIDEIQKIGEGVRGILLQEGIERLALENPQMRFVFLSPSTLNPEVAFSEAPAGKKVAVVPSDIPTVTQNLISMRQLPKNPLFWEAFLHVEGSHSIGQLELPSRPDNQLKRLSHVAFAVGANQNGTLVYANGAADAEKVAWQIFDLIGERMEQVPHIQEALAELSTFARDLVHPRFALVELLKRGVAYHYGNMPTLLRDEIERLFKEGAIRFLICTSTLIEGVNLACRTIVVRGPKRGRNQPMTPQDFWNLAGRAGRWGQEFVGNIVCIDTSREDLWPYGLPKKTKYPIKRETDRVLNNAQNMSAYLATRNGLRIADIDVELEQVMAYLISLKAQRGSLLETSLMKRLEADQVEHLDVQLQQLMSGVDIPPRIIARHSGISALALQSLLKYMRNRTKPIGELIPSDPASDDIYSSLIAILTRINNHLARVFIPPQAIPVFALVTVEWVRGLPLAQIINKRIEYLQDKEREFAYANVIRDTMRDVEEIARFKVPKFLAAYMDVLEFFLLERGKEMLFPKNLRFDLFLEFGVPTTTLLSLIGLGLSRSSAIAVNEYLGADNLSEEQILVRLSRPEWPAIGVSPVVRREVDRVVQYRRNLVA